MYVTNKGVTLDLKNAKEIASGGEGKIYEHPSNKKKVVKIYHQSRKADFANHLTLLSSLSSFFVKPEVIYFEKGGKVAGFDMPYVNFNNYWLFNNLFNKGFCTSNNIDKAFKVNVLQKLSDAVEEVNKKGIVIGDLNQYNLFVGKKGDVLFVDVDSYATPTSPHNGVLLDDIRDWTTPTINAKTDSWAYDILAFWATTYCHPFKWVVPGNSETLEQRVKTNRSFLSKISGMKIPALYEAPTGDNHKQFLEIFAGARYKISLGGYIPLTVQVKHQVVSNSLDIRELYDKVTDVIGCDDFLAVRIAGVWTLIETRTLKLTRQIKTVDCDILFPSNGGYAYVKNNILYSEKGNATTFYRPEFYCNNGYLSVLDYATDIQLNFNLNNQMAGIDNRATPIFAKSVIVRDAPIQNFGSKVYLNIPVNNTYNMIEVPVGTKNAIYCRDFWAIECRKRNKIEYMICSKSGSMDLDYLPFFTVKQGMVFVPDHGHIAVYKDHSLLMTLDATVCTRDSKLFTTNSGIILLENNTLYLLNTKQ